jgi:ADP-ribose pyrophosphatase YjhB (NUDIX family)
MARIRDTYCSYCGTKFAEPLAYPRTCVGCGVEIWANPIPVSVVLVPVLVEGARTGLLVVRRAIEPQKGKLAIVGGFLEEHESWQHGGTREIREETGATVDPATLETLWFASSAPRPNRVLLFSVAQAISISALPAFHHDKETSERGLVFGPDGLEAEFAFPLHVEAARKYFSARSITGPHAFRPA